MKSRTKIIIIISIIVLALIGIFSIYTEGYFFSHQSGIGLEYLYETDPEKILLEYPQANIVSINDDDLKDVPSIKRMLNLALEHELPLEDNGYEIRDFNWNSYWINQEGQGMRIQTALNDLPLEIHQDWAYSHMLESVVVEYKDRYFTFFVWIE